MSTLPNRIIQCDGGGGEDDSSEDLDTSETSVGSSESDSDDNSDENNDEEESKTSRNGPATLLAKPYRGRVTRQFVRDQQPSKRLLRSRKKSPVAGTSSKKPQVFSCPNCKKHFNNQLALKRHNNLCKPKEKNGSKQRTSDGGENERRASDSKRERNSQSAGESSRGTPNSGRGRGRGRGRPRKNAMNNGYQDVNSFYQNEQEAIPDDEFLHQRSPASSPGMPDTTSESDYEEREYAANAHHINSNRMGFMPINQNNLDQEEYLQYQYNNSQTMVMEMGQQEVVLDGPVTCQKCGMTYRTRSGYENHFPNCVALSSEEDEDEDVDVVDEEGHGQNELNGQQQIVQNLQHNSSLRQGQIPECSEESSSEGENDRLLNGNVQNRVEENVQVQESMNVREVEIREELASQQAHQTPQKVDSVPKTFVERREAQKEAAHLQTPPRTNHILPPTIQTDFNHSNFSSQATLQLPQSLHPAPPSTVPPNVPSHFMAIPSQSQRTFANSPTQPLQPSQYAYPPTTAIASSSTPILHHIQTGNNAPTYTQAQLMPGTVLHSSVIPPQQQMSTSTAPPPECYQSAPVSQPPSNLSQLPLNNSINQQGMRVQNGIPGLGTYQVPHQHQPALQQQLPPQIAPQQQQPQFNNFANLPPHIQQQFLRNGIMIDPQRLQVQQPQQASMQQLQPQQQQLPQQLPNSISQQTQLPPQVPMTGLPPGQLPNASFQNPYMLQQSQQLPQAPNQNLANQIQQQIASAHPQQSMTVQHPVNISDQSQQIMPQHQQMNPIATPSNPQPGTHFQQNQMQFQYLQQQMQQQIVNQSNGMTQQLLQMQQAQIQQSFIGQQQNLSGMPYQMVQNQHLTQPPQIVHSQQQIQASGNPQQAPPQLNSQMLQNNFQPQIMQSQQPEVQNQQQHQQLNMNNLQQQQLYQMQQPQQIQPAPIYGQRNPQQSQLAGTQQFMLNQQGLQWNRPGMPLMQTVQQQQQQFQRHPNPQQAVDSTGNLLPQNQFQPVTNQQVSQQLNLNSQQQLTQVIQQIAQITDGSGNTYIIVAPTPAVQPQQNEAGQNNSPTSRSEVQNASCSQPQQQQSPQMVHCALQAGVNGVVQNSINGAVPPGSAGRSGPCPCPTCKEKLGTAANVMEKYKKVLPYPSVSAASPSPTEQLKPILPNLGTTTRPILIRPAGVRQSKTVRQNVPVTLLHQNSFQAPASLVPQQNAQLQQTTTPVRMVPLAMKPVTNTSTLVTSSVIQHQSIPGLGVMMDTNGANRGSVPISSPNIAVVRPMENPLQKLTDQISQIESFMSPSPVPQQQSPQPQLQLQQSATPPNIPPQGPHLTLVTASPPQASLQRTLLATPSPIRHLQPLTASPSAVSPQQISYSQQAVVQNLQPRLMLVDHGTPPAPVPVMITPRKPNTPTPSATTPIRTATMAGVKRKLPGTPESTSAPTSSSESSIRLTLQRKGGGDTYSINQISGSASSIGTMKSLIIKGRIKNGEQAGSSTDVLVLPRIHAVPVPDPDTGGNHTIAEDGTGESGKSNHSSEGAPCNGKFMRRAVIVYEVQSNDTVLYRSSDVRAVWSYIFETVQGQRLNHNLPPLPYPAANIAVPNNDPEAQAAFNKLGLIHRAVQFLLEQLPGLKALSLPREATSSSTAANPTINSKAVQPPAIPRILSMEAEEKENEEEDEPIEENESGCAKTERFIGRKAFDMFGWLASKHRKPPVPCNVPMETATNLSAPIAMRFRKLKEKQDKNLVVWWSNIHGRGLYTKRDVERGEMIIEYTGELIRSILTDLREKYYESKSMGCYMFTINGDFVIDATMKGNAARFINHSCDPNCQAKILKISGKQRILIFALRRINRGEELTYDYKFEKEELKLPCMCGAKNCRKYLN